MGRWDVVVQGENGKREQVQIENRLSNAGLNLMRDALNGDAVALELTHVALGTSDGAINDADTALGAEGFRTAFISSSKPSTGSLQKTAIVLDSEAVMNIREIGIFAGGTGVAGSGTLVSRVLWSRNKTALESITFLRTDTIGRA